MSIVQDFSVSIFPYFNISTFLYVFILYTSMFAHFAILHICTSVFLGFYIPIYLINYITFIDYLIMYFLHGGTDHDPVFQCRFRCYRMDRAVWYASQELHLEWEVGGLALMC